MKETPNMVEKLEDNVFLKYNADYMEQVEYSIGEHRWIWFEQVQSRQRPWNNVGRRCREQFCNVHKSGRERSIRTWMEDDPKDMDLHSWNFDKVYDSDEMQSNGRRTLLMFQMLR